MDRKELYHFFVSKGNSGIKPTEKNLERYFHSVYGDFLNWLIVNNWTEPLTFPAKFYCFLNDIKGIPICPECGNENKFKQLSFGFFRYCSAKCSANSKSTRSKCEKTCLDKYGHINIAHGTIRDKIQETFDKKYGGHPSKNKQIKDKVKKSFNEKYGGHPFANDEIKEKIKKSWEEKYGCDNPLRNESIKKKVISTKYERGILVDWSKNPEILEDFIRYKRSVKYYTEITFRKHYYEINPDGKSRAKNKWHLDHIYPIIEGWKNNIDPVLISNSKNLQMLWCTDNHSKCDRTDMTVEDFLKLIKNN